MCSVKSNSFRFKEVDNKTEDELIKQLTQEFQLKHHESNNEQMNNVYERFKNKKSKDDDDAQIKNECQDCIEVPEKFSYNEFYKFWTLLISLQKELGDL